MPPTHRTIDERTELPPGYRLQAADTSYSVERVLVERWRATPLADKAAQLGSSFRALEALSAAGVRLRYPHASTREIWLGTVSLRLGPALTEDVYGSHQRS